MVLASGLKASFVISFRPQSLQDHLDQLEVQVENTKNGLKVPIRAQRSLPLLNIPERLDLGLTLEGFVKKLRHQLRAQHDKLVVTRKYRFQSQSAELSVNPAEVELCTGKKQSQEIVWHFNPREIGPFSTNVDLVSDSGHVSVIPCHGSMSNLILFHVMKNGQHPKRSF
ncbi:hypothetical protein Ciccas_007210 [Cichlidogyrus casuarinus]|uniref:Uncharacterized protein n=1 Tax=Cichlidogyrus casuarinus TaxID=1844966 RepID=A0ABD2Q3I9_9PLAT